MHPLTRARCGHQGRHRDGRHGVKRFWGWGGCRRAHNDADPLPPEAHRPCPHARALVHAI